MSTYLGTQLLSGVGTNTIANAHSLFDFKWTDHILNEMSWLRSDTFSWHNGDVYVAAYNHLKNDLENSTSQKIFYRYKNCYVVGSLDNSNGVLTNFNNVNNYLISPHFNPGSSTWEHITKFKTNPDYSVGQILVHPWGVNCSLASWIDTNGKLRMHASSNGTSWNICSDVLSTSTLSPNTVYWTKFEFTGSAYNIWLSTDGINYNLECTYSSSTPIYSSSATGNKYGSWTDGRYITEIDLKESYYKIGNTKYDLSGNIIEYIAEDGHKIVDPSQENDVEDMYQNLGVSWYYIVDTENKRFKLPRELPITDKLKGNGMTLGLTDGTNNYGFAMSNTSTTSPFTSNGYGGSVGSSASVRTNSSDISIGVTPDADKSGIISHRENLNGYKYLYFYVGDYDVSDITGINLENRNAITNCITEIPQDIKLELSEGTLTLKAGSKVYIPNGFESDGTTPKFDVVNIESDISAYGVTADTSTRLLYYNHRGMNVYVNSQSGSTTPTGSGNIMFYNTSDNTVKKYNSGSLVDSEWSLPIGIITADGTNLYGSIDQIFNGFGYIGSTMFILPGVKCLIPNGRKSDGTLKNIEAETKSVLTRTTNSNQTGLYHFGLSYTDTIGMVFDSYYEYSKANNRNYASGDLWLTAPFASMILTNGVISNFNPKQAFHALDYSDIPEVTKNILEVLYPIGGVYIGTQAACPMTLLMPGTTWELVSSGKALWTGNGTAGSGTTTNANYANAPANTTIGAGLPNITGEINHNGAQNSYGQTYSGAFSSKTVTANQTGGTAGNSKGNSILNFNASSSNSTYGKSSTVQPPAYVVNVWRRTA